ncbi:hypothetical protein ACFL6S_13965 [Candidatus Poribacteria bacterium]
MKIKNTPWYEDKAGMWHRTKKCPILLRRGLSRMNQQPGWRQCTCKVSSQDDWEAPNV